MSDEEVKKDCIVVAEDSPPNRKILTHLLTKLGYDVIACEDGKIARETLENEPPENLVAIISDIMMPNEDGIQLLKYVRGHEKFKSLPFLLVTAVVDRDYIIEAKSHAVNGYILKPVTFQRVTSKLSEIFPRKTFPKLAG